MQNYLTPNFSFAPIIPDHAQGIDAVFPIIRQLGSLEEILQHGRDNLVSAAQNVARIYQMGISRK